MKRWGPRQLLTTLVVSLMGWAVVAVLCMMVGSTHFGWPVGSWELAHRRDIVLQASLVGAALASAGVAFQAILRNPLAEPYLLGVSTGAALASYLWRFRFATGLLVAMGLGMQVAQSASQQIFAFAGALLSVGIVFLLANRRGRLEPVTLLLVGVIVNSINAALFLLVNALYKDLPDSGDALSFLVGSIQTNLSRQQLIIATSIIGVGWIYLWSMAGSLNAAGLSDDEASAMGVRIHLTRWITLLVASLMTASAVAISGPIGFIGLICPHLVRLVVGHDHRRLLPYATACGAAMLAMADAATRSLASQSGVQTLLPVGVLTAMLGGPFFLLILWRQRKLSPSAGEVS